MINVDLSFLVTVVYVIILYIFLSRVFFGPMTGILHKRRALIEGRLEEARNRMEQVEQRTAEYEQALRTSRAEAYRLQEKERERTLVEKAELITKAKSEADKTLQEGRALLTAEAQAARKKMEAEIDALANKLTTAILRD